MEQHLQLLNALKTLTPGYLDHLVFQVEMVREPENRKLPKNERMEPVDAQKEMKDVVHGWTQQYPQLDIPGVDYTALYKEIEKQYCK